MSRVAFVAAAIWFAATGVSSAADLYASGEQARGLCDERADWCVGFVTGALDGWSALEAYFDGDKFCIPRETTTGELAKRFREELAAEGTDLKQPAAYILFERMIRDFPCA